MLAESSEFLYFYILYLHYHHYLALLYTCVDHVNVLLVGSGDLRHMLTTVAHASSHTHKPVHVR